MYEEQNSIESDKAAVTQLRNTSLLVMINTAIVAAILAGTIFWPLGWPLASLLATIAAAAVGYTIWHMTHEAVDALAAKVEQRRRLTEFRNAR